MKSVIYRLDRGRFFGLVSQNVRGPWSGWFSYSWTAGDKSGGCDAIGRAYAVNALHAAYCGYVNEQQLQRDTAEC